MKSQTPLFDLIDNLSVGEAFFLIALLFACLFLFRLTVKYMVQNRTDIKKLEQGLRELEELRKANSKQTPDSLRKICNN
jgi:hypothetical protein